MLCKPKLSSNSPVGGAWPPYAARATWPAWDFFLGLDQGQRASFGSQTGQPRQPVQSKTCCSPLSRL